MDSLIKSPIIDTAVHLWDAKTYHRMNGDWLDAHPKLKRSWLPADLEKELLNCSVRQAVIIEAARDSLKLNQWWLGLAQQHAFLGPVVAGCKLEQDDLSSWLDCFSQSKQFVGIRTMPAGEPATWNENRLTARGIKELARRDLCLELLVGWQSFSAVAALAATAPSLLIILDHCGIPPFSGGKEEWAAWSEGLRDLAQLPNVIVKYASLLLYADPVRELEKLIPPVNFLLETFGPTRLMWGSNWPVELDYGSYRETFDVMRSCAGQLSPNEQAALWGGTAMRVYKIGTPGLG